MHTEKIVALTKSLNEARNALDFMQYQYSLLNLNGHQQTIHVRIGDKGESFSLAEIDHKRNYAAVAIRGTEMVMLGVKKLYAARIDDMKQRIASIEHRIRTEAGV